MTNDEKRAYEDAHLIIHDSAGAPDRWVTLEGTRVRVGRVAGREAGEGVILLPSPKVSRDHAEFVLVSAGWTLHDRESTNGTLVDGIPAAGATLHHGAAIEFGDVRATFHMPSADAMSTIRESRREHRPRARIAVDSAQRRIRIDGSVMPLRLGRLEFDLLALLDRQNGAVVHHQTIVRALWGEGAQDGGALHQLVHRLRRKLSGTPIELVAVPGVGFMLECPPRPPET